MIGASTGGTEAVRTLVGALPAACPPVLVTQHMPAGFTRIFAERLNDTCALRASEAVDGHEPQPGELLIAPGGVQMSVVRRGDRAVIRLGGAEKVNGHCPSVEPLMVSAAAVYGPRAVGVILTGMGRDGAEGLRAMREAGARTLAQDEASCVVYGMPKVAWEIGAAERQVPLNEMAGRILTLLSRSKELV